MVDFEQKDKYSVADLLRIMEILRAGSETAKAAAAQTLDKMKHAMMIDYFA